MPLCSFCLYVLYTCIVFALMTVIHKLWFYTECHDVYENLVVSIVKSLLRKKVQVGKDQEKAQSEKDSHSKNRGGKKPN